MDDLMNRPVTGVTYNGESGTVKRVYLDQNDVFIVKTKEIRNLFHKGKTKVDTKTAQALMDKASRWREQNCAV